MKLGFFVTNLYLPGEENFNSPYRELAKDRFLLGSPDEVVEEIRRYEAELDANYLIFRMQWPGMEQRQVLRQIELLGQGGDSPHQMN